MFKDTYTPQPPVRVRQDPKSRPSTIVKEHDVRQGFKFSPEEVTRITEGRKRSPFFA